MSFIINRQTNTSDAEETQTQTFQDTTLDIGRGSGALVHLDDLRVSLQHATIEQIGHIYILKDLDSANGTYVNRARIHEHQLADHDEIQIGPYTLHVRLGAAAEPVTLLITQEAAPVASEAEADAIYLAKYTLASGRVTQKRLSAFAVMLILGGLVGIVTLSKTPSSGRLHTALSPGKVSTVHRFFEDACSTCHQGVWQNVADTACETCHSGPMHHETQRFTPRCASCHQEHRSRQEDLKVMANPFCTQCHANLHTRQPTASRFANEIRSFVDGHPEFAVAVQTDAGQSSTRVRLNANAKDTAQIKLNHNVHLRPDKLGPKGFTQLTCGNCHQADSQGAYMRPITYQDHCIQCHSLEFDPRFPKQAVPHRSPKVVEQFLVDTFTQYVLNHLEACEAKLHKPIRQRPGHPPTPTEAQSIKACVNAEVQTVERYLFEEKTCKECHLLRHTEAGQLPDIVKPAIPPRWFPNSVFNHQAHIRAGRACEDCHDGVRQSERSSDVLLPGIATCQDCHTTSGGARSACVTCHTYHDKTETHDLTPQRSHEALWRRSASASPPRPASN